jgi:hypothetical protein
MYSVERLRWVTDSVPWAHRWMMIKGVRPAQFMYLIVVLMIPGSMPPNLYHQFPRKGINWDSALQPMAFVLLADHHGHMRGEETSDCGSDLDRIGPVSGT